MVVLCYIAAEVFAADEYSRSLYFVTEENTSLLVAQTPKKVYSTSVLSCSQECVKHSWCTYTNFKDRIGGKGVCELITHEADNVKLTNQPGTKFSMILKVSKCRIHLRKTVKEMV